jgi:hypothetical protein
MWLPEPLAPSVARVVVLALYGRIKSGRDKEFNKRTSEDSHRAWAKENERRFEKVATCGVRAILRETIHTWHKEGFKARLTAIAHRKGEQIDDYKNLVVGIDQGILDGMKHGGVLIDDSMNHIDHQYFGQVPAEGEEFVWLRFDRGGPCPEFVKQQAMKQLRIPTEFDPRAITARLRAGARRRRRF